MPIFDNELINNTSNRGAAPERPYLASPDTLEVDVNINPVQGGNIGGNNISRKGMSIDEMSSLTHAPSKGSTFSSPMGMARRSELIDNQRYPVYQRGVDLENIYGLQQSAFTQLGHSLIKTGIRAAGTFAQSLTNIPNAISAAKNADSSKLAGDPNGYEGGIDHWVNNFENTIPNYYSRYEKEHPHLAMIPGFTGSANFWGESVLKNLGFTAGAIAGAAIQDLAVGVLTEGIGEIPLVASQIGKASLWFNKILSGTNDAEKVLDIAKAAGAGQKALLSAESLAHAAAYTKVANGFRYGTSLLGSAMTEAGVEGRDSYETVKKTLLENYKLDHPGEEITAEEAGKIEEYATNAMNTRFGINMALLTVSNAIQFDNLFKSFSNAEKGVVGSLTKTLEDTGKIGLKEGSLDVFEKKGAANISEKIWDVVKPKLTNVLSEGVYEEGGQFAAEKGTYDYYTRKYKNLNNPENKKSWDALNETMHSTAYGLSEQFNTTEGIDNMLIGGLTAVITGGIQGKIDNIRGNGKDARLTSSINMLNKYGLTGILSNKYDNTLNSIGIAKEMEDAANSKNIFKYKNLKHDMFFNFVQSRIPSGMHDVTIDQLTMLKDLSKEDFEKTFGMDFNTSNKKTVDGYVDTLIDEANSIKETTDAINNTYKNPFKFTVDPKNEDDHSENLKYNTFESWKTDLSYFNSVKIDSTDRLASIQNDLININPMLTNAGLADILDKESLTDLAKSYEEEANRLNNTITEYTSNTDKKATRAQVKTLRTNSEKINIALGKNDLDLKTFHSLLNFELNNQDATKDDIVGLDKAPDLYNLGADVVQHNLRKKQAIESFNNLSTKEGFDKYFKQADNIANDEVDEEDLFPQNKKEPTFVNDSKEREKLEVGREYTIDKTKRVNVRKIADDRYQVTAPDGTVSFHKTKESAQEEAKDLSGENTNLSKVKVIGITDEGLVKVEDVNGDILNIDPKRLRGYRSIETQEEKLAKNKEQLDREQTEIEKNSGTVATVDTSSTAIQEEGKLKSISKLFTSSTTASEDYSDPTQSAAHITRSRSFLNKVKSFKNRSNIKAILVTPNQVNALGLTGLVQMSYGVILETPLSDIENVNDIDKGFVAQVFIVQENGKNYFISEDGKKLSEVGEQVDVNQVVFQTMPTTSLYYDNGTPRFRSDEEAKAESYSNAWKEYRSQLFSSPDNDYRIFDFNVSRGIPNIEDDAATNQVGDILIPESKINSAEGLITISTTGAIDHNGEAINFPVGVPVLQYGDTLQFLNNRRFNDREAKGVFQTIKALAEDTLKQSEAGKSIRLNRGYTDFLQNVLFWKSKGKETLAPNQISLNTSNMTINLGGNSYALTDIANNESAIIDQLKNTYISVNNKSLTKDFSIPFTEYYINQAGEFTSSEWKNYQSFLLSSKYPSGKVRPEGDTPLTTNVAKPTEAVPYSFKQKYSTLTGVEFNLKAATPKKAAPAKTAGPKIGEYNVDGETVNDYKLSGDRIVNFTASINDGVVSAIVVSNSITQELASDSQKMSDIIIPQVKAIAEEKGEQFDATKTDEQYVFDYLSNAIASDLQNQLAPQEEVVEEVSKPEEIIEETPESDTYNPENTEYPDVPFRKVGGVDVERMTNTDIEAFKEWHAANVPNIPFEILQNIITTHDGEKAWGAFENGVAKFMKGGQRGTEYHEIFEAIYNAMLSKDQQQELLDEFKSKPGKFLDRESGKKINYDEATDLQAKERIADDFADFRLGKLAARTLGERISKFFKSIVDFFKAFVTKPSVKSELFKAINTGKFKEEVLKETNNEFAQYSRVGKLSVKQTQEYIEDITARAAGFLFSESQKGLLFSPEKITSAEMFSKIEAMYIKEGKLQELGASTWKDLKVKTLEKLRTLGVNFNADDVISINDEEANKNDYAPEPFSVDWKKNSTGAIKFSLSTLLQVAATNQQNNLSLVLPAPEFSSVRGLKLLNFSKAFATVLDKLSNTSSIDVATNKLLELSVNDPNYARLYQRVRGTLPLNEFSNDDWRYFIQFMQTFTKQKPEALIQYKSGNEVYTGAANLYTAVSQVQQGWVENMKAIAKVPKSIISFDKKNKVYVIDETKLKEFDNSEDGMINMLNAIGVNFSADTYKRLKTSQKNTFVKAVSSIKSYLGKNNQIMSITGKTLDINGQLSNLAELLVKVTNPNQDSTYFGVEGQRIGTYANNNAPSLFENEFNESETLDELLEKRPELNDIFSENSQVLKKGGLFFDEEGNRIKSIKVKYIQGTKNTDTNKGTSTSKLTLGDRFTQEINQNINGRYYILIPADGSTEWAMDLGNTISFANVEKGNAWKQINNVFRGYLNDEVSLALDFENRKQLNNVASKAKELRFFKDILSEKDLNAINDLIDNNATQEQVEKYISDNIDTINESIKNFIDSTANETKNVLLNTGEVLFINEGVYSYAGLDSTFAQAENLDKFNMNDDILDNLMTFTAANYIISNIELHKVLFGDPYQFKIKGDQLDETKRIKSFLSPRLTTFDTPEYNTWLNENMNAVEDIKLASTDPGYHNYKAYANTITVSDINVAGSLSNLVKDYSKTNEADAMSWISDGAYKEVKLKNGQWSNEAEAFHQWQLAYTRQNLPGYTYSSDKLEAHDKELISKPAPKYTIEVLKPIVSGNKYNKNNFDLVLDKFSQMPIYYSMVKGTNLENLYIQMMKQGVDYAIMESGRKVGIEGMHSLYNADGSFNEEAFNNNVQVPWKAYGIQVETATEGDKTQTRGSQLTKLSSMDLFNNGVASSPAAEKEYKRNTDILNKMNENAYNTLLNKLGLTDTGNGFTMDSVTVSETLVYEMLRREVSQNTKDTVQLDDNGEFRIPFEASPSYVQIRSIIYAMVNKALISPKLNGGAHVQVPATMFESATKGRSLAIKTEKGWEKISKTDYNKLSDEDKKKVMLTDDTLKFYTRENPYCEVMLPHWFKGKFGNKTDEEIIKYLNNTEEGRSILSGIGFRIPTQALSSVEVFRVKGFLPQYMGATVVVPSEITTKAGSDFDIDKLNMYLKAVYTDRSGNVKLVKYLGTEEATKDFYSKVFDDTLAIEQMAKADLIEAVDIIINGLEDPKGLIDKYGNYILSVQDEYDNPYDFRAIIENKLEKLTDSNLQSGLREDFVNDMYKKSLENEYYDSLAKLLTLPENFDRLISPVDDAGLKTLSEKLDKLRGYNEGDIKNRLLNRNYMTSLRHAFVIAKRWVGISAVNITNLSLKQKSKVYIDPTKFEIISEKDRNILGDGKVNIKHNTVDVDGKQMISLSGTNVADDSDALISGRLSGYATAFVDVAKDPFILKLIQSNSVVGTFMFLENIGAGEEGIMFLNQPIIDEYLKIVDNARTQNLFNDALVDFVQDLFPTTQTLLYEAKVIPANFESNISGYYTGKLNEKQNAEQHVILKEFLKYAKMAEYNYKFTQATNYDTTRFGSGEEFSKKQLRTDNARSASIISSVDNVLNTTFIGKLEKLLSSSMQSMGAIFRLEQDDMRIITEDVLRPFSENEYLSADNYNKVALQIKSSFLDYIIQTKTGLNAGIKQLIVDNETSVAARLEKAKAKYPNIQILKDLQIVSGDRVDGAKSVKLVANIKDAYDEDIYVGMMRELRDTNPELNQLYKDLVSVSILQGGYQSAISIKNIIPIEDYSEIVTPVVNSITSNESLQAFSKGMFQRNNFADDAIMPVVQPKFFTASDMPIGEQVNSIGEHYADVYQYYSSLFPNVDVLNIKSTDRKILLLNPKYNYFDVKNDFVKVPRVVTDRKTGANIDMVTGKTITKLDYVNRKKKGDYSLQDVFGYAKVKLATGEPLINYETKNNKTEEFYVYKLVNLYGDGQRANEHYSDFRQSVIENGTIQINQEIPDADIIEYYGGEITKKDVSLPTSVETLIEKPEDISQEEWDGLSQEEKNKINEC